MSPPGQTATRNHPGGSTPTRAGSPIEAAIRAAHTALLDSGVPITPRKVNRIVRRFASRAKRDGWTFHQYLSDAAELTPDQRRNLLAHPDWEVTIAYFDPTGETAVANVMRSRRATTTPPLPQGAHA